MGLHKHILSGFLKFGMSFWGPCNRSAIVMFPKVILSKNNIFLCVLVPWQNVLHESG